MRVALDGDAVLVHYSGYLDDGTMFDTSYERDEPLNFVIGGGDVIRGFDDVCESRLFPNSFILKFQMKYKKAPNRVCTRTPSGR